MDGLKLLTVREVARVCSLSVRQIWKLLKSGDFPHPVRIATSVRWRERDLADWVNSLREVKQ